MDNSKTHKFSYYRLIAILGLSAIILASAAATGIFDLICEMSSIGLIVGITFFMLLGIFGQDFLKFIPDSFLTLFCTPSMPNKKYAEIARTASRYVITAAAIATATRIFNSLQNLSCPESLGINTIAVSLPFFYALIISEIFFAFLYKSYSGEDDSIKEPYAPFNKSTISIIIIVMICLNFLMHVVTTSNMQL